VGGPVKFPAALFCNWGVFPQAAAKKSKFAKKENKPMHNGGKKGVGSREKGGNKVSVDFWMKTR